MKQVILINDSLDLPRGKLAAQVAHASVASFLNSNSSAQKEWLQCGMPKVVLSASSEEDLLRYYQQAIDANLPAQLIEDAGRTVVASGTLTCIGIGPAEISEIDQITSSLKLVN
jgi:PTH2 family peptidyl-tRNA hydrolase